MHWWFFSRTCVAFFSQGNEFGHSCHEQLQEDCQPVCPAYSSNQAQMTSGEQKFCFCLMFYFWYSLQKILNFSGEFPSLWVSLVFSLSCPQQNHSNANIFVEILWACSSTIIWFSRLCLFLFWKVVIGLLVFSVSTCFLGSSFSLFLVADFSPPKSLINCRKSERY